MTTLRLAIPSKPRPPPKPSTKDHQGPSGAPPPSVPPTSVPPAQAGRGRVKQLTLSFRERSGAITMGTAPGKSGETSQVRFLPSAKTRSDLPLAPPSAPSSSSSSILGTARHQAPRGGRVKQLARSYRERQGAVAKATNQDGVRHDPKGEQGRSAPDGSELEGCPRLSPEREPSPAAPTKPPQCCCVCHLQHPGMQLVWVPLQPPTCDQETPSGDKKSKPLKTASTETAASRRDENGHRGQRESRTNQSDGVHVLNVHEEEGSRMCTKKPVHASAVPPHLDRQTARPPSTHNSGECDGVYETLDWSTDTPMPSPTLSPQPTAPLPKTQPGPAAVPRPPTTTSNEYIEVLPSPKSSGRPPGSYTPPEQRKLPPLPVATPAPSDPDHWAGNRPAMSYMLSPRGGFTSCRIQSRFARDPPQTPRSKPHKETGTYEEWEKVEKKEVAELNIRSISNDWDANHEDEPLYQIYQAKVSEEATRPETDSPQSCKRSVGQSLGLEGPGGPGPGGGRAGRCPAQSRLWQDLPVVRDSGVLQKLSHTEIQRQESMFEVLTSEASYLRSLRVLKDHFLGSRELNETLLVQDRKILFSSVLQVYEASERFMEDLVKRADESVVISDVCDIIHHHTQNYFSIYTEYVRDQVYQEKMYTTLMQTNRLFALVMRRLEDSSLCKRLPFTSFLLLPFQRITRIKILIQSILKRTAVGSSQESTASKALAAVSEIIREANTQVGQMKQMEELIQVANMLEFDKLKAIPIVTKSRCLEKQGELQELFKGGSFFSIRFRFTPVYLFLFNDLLLFTCKRSPERFVVLDHAHRSLVQVQGFGSDAPGPRLENSFCVTLLENHEGHTCERLLKANTESDMHRWMAAFPCCNEHSGQPEDDRVYQDWDCPQFRCIRPYKSKQKDELSLEPADIINVLHKTKEGWFEGIRLSDRQRGWFPQEHVMEVTNEHQRRKNLREQYRIARASSAENKDCP